MRPEKQSLVQEIRQKAEAAEFVVLTDYKGMTVEQFTQLRGSLRAVGAEIHVVKNRLLRVVGQERGWAGLTAYYRSPSAMVSGRNVVEALKALKKFRSENPAGLPGVKAGMLGSALLTARDIEDLASLPSRQELLAQAVGAIAAPLTSLVGVLHRKVSSLLYVLKAIEQKKSA